MRRENGREGGRVTRICIISFYSVLFRSIPFYSVPCMVELDLRTRIVSSRPCRAVLCGAYVDFLIHQV